MTDVKLIEKYKGAEIWAHEHHGKSYRVAFFDLEPDKPDPVRWPLRECPGFKTLEETKEHVDGMFKTFPNIARTLFSTGFDIRKISWKGPWVTRRSK